ncbi:MAG TPA: hypothetical protein DCQ53_05790, partial [Alphaproteobacteria bacterium]|nr:hypothetical protein [Alphaproteobacteria bacterium]
MLKNLTRWTAIMAATVALAACDRGGEAPDTESEAEAAAVEANDDDGGDSDIVRINTNPYPSTYAPLPSETTLITNATIFDGVGGRIENGS